VWHCEVLKLMAAVRLSAVKFRFWLALLPLVTSRTSFALTSVVTKVYVVVPTVTV